MPTTTPAPNVAASSATAHVVERFNMAALPLVTDDGGEHDLDFSGGRRAPLVRGSARPPPARAAPGPPRPARPARGAPGPAAAPRPAAPPSCRVGGRRP